MALSATLSTTTALAANGTWNLNAAGTWSNPANWLGGVPNAEGDVATFGNVITANRTITVDGLVTVGRINFNDNNSYILAGSSPNGLRFDGAHNTNAVISVSGPQINHTISAPMTLLSSLDVTNTHSFALNLNGVISGGGGLSLSGAVRFNGVNTYTGETHIAGGGLTSITVNSAGAFGAASGGTTVTDSSLVTLNALGSERFTITGSAIVLLANTVAATTYTPAVTLGSGGRLSFIKPMTFDAPLVLAGGEGVLENNVTIGSGATFSGGGTLVLKGPNVAVNAPITHAGGVTVGDSSVVHFNVAHSFAGPLTVRGALQVNESQTVSRLVLQDGGTYALAAGKSLGITDGIDLTGFGNVNLALATALPVTRRGNGTSTVTALGAGYDGPVHIRQGNFVVAGPDALGTTAGATTVSGAGRLLIQNGQTVNDTIFLDNATGPAWSGALGWQELSGVNAPAVVAGRVDLGSVGSYVAGGNLGVDLAGPITGGSLTAVTNLVRITGNQNTYTGHTRAKNVLRLIEQGRLSTTSEIISEYFAEVILDNGGSVASNDRLADSIPITLRGGAIRLTPSPTGPVSESIGHVTAAHGAAEISAQYYQSNVPQPATLTVAGVTRGSGAVVNFHGSDLGGQAKIILTDAPALNDGIIGGWATSGGSFATYTATGVRGLQNFQHDVNNDGPAANIQITNTVVNASGQPTLTADRTVNSIATFTNTIFDLNGHTLTVDTGGIIGNDATTITDGTLAAGAGSGGELFLYGNLRVEADIPGGSVTVGPRASALLLGTNSYTGPTIVHGGGNIGVMSPAALAPDSVVEVNAGRYSLAYDSPTPARLKRVTLRGPEGIIDSQGVLLDAGAYDVQRGMLFARLSGNGTMTKTTDGEVIIRDDNSNYSGAILIEQGTLRLGDDTSIYSPNALGTGTTTVKRGGRLVVRFGNVNGRIVLAGGEVLGLGSTLNNGLTVVGVGDGDGSGGGGGGGNATSTLANSEASATTALDTTIAGVLDIAANAILEVPAARGTITVTGDAHVDGSLRSAGTVKVVPAAGKTVDGAGQIEAALTVAAGGGIAPGNSPGTLGVSTAVFAPAGAYTWEIDDAAGTAGVAWDLLDVADQLSVTATSANPFVIRLVTLSPGGGGGGAGALGGFDHQQGYAWPIAQAGALSGFAPGAFSIDASGFANNLGGGSFAVESSGSQLILTFTPVPEPAAATCIALFACSWLLPRRRARGPG